MDIFSESSWPTVHEGCTSSEIAVRWEANKLATMPARGESAMAAISASAAALFVAKKVNTAPIRAIAYMVQLTIMPVRFLRGEA